MTTLYEFSSMPQNKLAVICPECKSEAAFNFARSVRIELNKDIDTFKDNKHLTYSRPANSDGQKYSIATFYPGLDIENHENIQDLPEGYNVDMWGTDNHSHNPDKNGEGVVICECGTRRKHKLKWPQDAFYKLNYRKNNLWAYNRETTIVLRDYIKSDERKNFGVKWQFFLLHVPKPFLVAKARKPLVAKIDKLLASS